MQGPEQGEWTRRVEADLDNIRGGIALALQGGVDPILGVKFAVALLGFWMLRGYATEGRNYIRAALALPVIALRPAQIKTGISTDQFAK